MNEPSGGSSVGSQPHARPGNQIPSASRVFNQTQHTQDPDPEEPDRQNSADPDQRLHQGSSKPPELLALERKYADLEKSFTRVAIKHELLERELSNRPSRPGPSSR